MTDFFILNNILVYGINSYIKDIHFKLKNLTEIMDRKKMETDTAELIELKKKTLLPFLPYVEKMLLKLRGNKYEDYWVKMRDCIQNDKKR